MSTPNDQLKKLEAENVVLRARLAACQSLTEKLLEDNARGAAYLAHLKEIINKQGGAA